jgi:hypothetical protein
MDYIGDFTSNAVVRFKFFTHEITGNSASVPVTLAGTPVLSVYKNNGLVQSTTGITLIVDFDTITGLNDVVISLDSDAFYEAHADYQVVITTGTVGGNSTVGRIVGAFSIDNRSDHKILNVVSNIATGAAAAAVPAELDVITTGTEVNTYASTQTLDGGYHEISDVAGTIDMYYQFDIGANNTATSIAMNGRLEGADDSIGVYAYNWGTTSWNQIGTLQGVPAAGADDAAGVFTLLNVHTGSGGDEGKVRIRGLGSGLTSATLFIDRASLRYASEPAPSVVDIRTEIDTNSTKLIDILADTNELQLDDIPATLATIAGYLDTEITAIINAVGVIDSEVGTLQTTANTINTAVGVVDTVVDGIQTDLSNGTDGLGALKALLDTLDTVADAIKVKTDQLTFTKALELDTNTQSINGSTVVGDGKITPWEGT